MSPETLKHPETLKQNNLSEPQTLKTNKLSSTLIKAIA